MGPHFLSSGVSVGCQELWQVQAIWSDTSLQVPQTQVTVSLPASCQWLEPKPGQSQLLNKKMCLVDAQPPTCLSNQDSTPNKKPLCCKDMTGAACRPHGCKEEHPVTPLAFPGCFLQKETGHKTDTRCLWWDVAGERAQVPTLWEPLHRFPRVDGGN